MPSHHHHQRSMMRMPSTETAVHMNLRGVYRLEEGRYGEAISEFSNALTAVKSVLSEKDATGELDNSVESSFNRVQKLAFEFYDASEEDDDDDQEEEETTNTDLYISANGKKSGTVEARSPQEEDGRPFIFQCPIIASYVPLSDLSPRVSQEEQSQESFFTLVKFSSAILFNLALSYHLAAIKEEGGKQKKMFVKALTFYKLSYTMMQDSRNDGLMETMAIANNLGHVQLTVGDAAKAKQCYEHLLSTIMFVTGSGADRSSIQHFDGFFHSVQTMVLPSQETAQAA